MSSLTKHPQGQPAPFAIELGRRVRAQRQARGMSQAEVGRPFSRAYISLVESGRTLPSLPALLHIAVRLGVDPCSARCAP